MKSFVTGWMSHSHISYGIIRVGLGTHIGRGTLNPSIGTPIPSIYMDGWWWRRTKKWGKSNHYYQELIHQLFIYITPMHSEKYNTATVGVSQKKGRWAFEYIVVLLHCI